MSLPSLSGTARLYADVELRYAANGNPVTKVPLVFNSRRKNQQGEWEDADSCFVTGTLFKDRAEWAAEKLNRGDEVVVSGRLKTRSWEDKEGNKRSTTELLIDEIGPTLRTLMPKAGRSQGGGQGQRDTYGGQRGASRPDDPWSTGPASNDDTEPPF